VQGFYYLLSLIGFWIIVMWLLQNDGLRPGEPTKGLLRMTEPGSAGDGSAMPADRSANLLQRRAGDSRRSL
jgi:hypothetical protein